MTHFKASSEKTSTVSLGKSTDKASQKTGRVLVVDDHAKARESMADVLQHAGYQVTCCASAAEALQLLETREFEVILTDMKMPGMTGLEFIRELRDRETESQILMVTAHASVASAVEAMRYGAFDYIEKPLRAGPLEELVARAMCHGEGLQQGVSVPPSAGGRKPVTMIGSSAAMMSLRERIAQIAPTNETVLITGESGTGKELVAKSVHAASQRADKSMISLNCPVLSAHLMESELFGHERGAFTSADASRVGRFELADGGVILLDEITEIDLSLQAKLLRVLQERTFERIGSSTTIEVDTRVLATTNRDLRKIVAEGKFREDLYFRLAVLPLHVPPLRERIEDIPELVDHFQAETANRIGNRPCTLNASAEDLLMNYRWPGNVRELENVITRCVVLSAGKTVDADHIRPWLIDAEENFSQSVTPSDQLPVGLSLQEMEHKLILATLEQFDGHRAKTAKALGIGVRTLSSKLREYGVAPRAKTLTKVA